MKRLHHHKSQKGFTVIEVSIALVVLSTTIAGTVGLQNYTLQKVRQNNERAFAIQKSMQMYNELRAMVDGNREDNFENLSNFSDGSKYNTTLTVEKNVQPGDPLSSNPAHGDGWKFVRQVQVLPVPHDTFAKQVKVAVWYANADGEPKHTKPLSVISGVLKTNIPVSPPSQEFNIYGLAIANTLPHYQIFDELIPSFQGIVDSLEFRNPGLRLNRDLITVAAYGRDPFYLPFYNDQTNTRDVHTPWVYHYPGKVRVSNPGDFPGDPNRTDYLYEYLGGRVWGETAGTQNHLSNLAGGGPYRPFAMADQFNHALRFPEHRAMEKRVQQWARASINPATATLEQMKLRNSLLQPTLYSFLEDLNTSDRYRNSILVSMHGNSLPLPPLRNYSDPARLPLDQHGSTNAEKFRYEGMRLISHPEKLEYANNEAMQWRVYAYNNRPSGCDSPYSRNYANDGIAITNPCSTASTNAVTTDMMNYAVDVATLFIPTDGGGPLATDPKGGYLENPDIDDVTTIKNNLSLTKIVGSRNRQYEQMTSAEVTNRPYMQLTAKDIKLNSDTWAEARTQGLQQVGTDAGISAASADSITVDMGATGTTIQNAYRDLINQRLVIGIEESDTTKIGYEHEDVLRVKEITFSGSQVTITFFASPNLSSTTGLRVARRKDYEIFTSSDRPSAFSEHGYTRQGVIVRLLDTPIFHHLHDNIQTGSTLYANARRHRTGTTPANKTGLDSTARLYHHEYIPAPVSGTHFNRNLTEAHNTNAKNTARWLVSLSPTSSLNNQLVTMETRFGTELADGIAADGSVYAFDSTTDLRFNPYNVSRTYVYRGDRKAPFLETIQFTGDPRYMPYADVKANGNHNKYYTENTANSAALGTGYSDFGERTLFSGSTYINGSKTTLPYTDGIMKSHAIFGSLTARPAFFVTLGGEICGWQKFKMEYDLKAQNYHDTSNTNLINNRNGGAGNACDLPESNPQNASARLPMAIRNASGQTKQTGNWVARLDQGELFPDELYTFWLNNGNLPNLQYSESDRRTTNLNLRGAAWSGSNVYNVALNSLKENGSAQNKFFRALYPDTPFRLKFRGTGLAGGGDPGFWNGSSETPTQPNRTISITVQDGQAIVLTGGDGEAGRYLSDAFNLVMPKTFSARHTFRLTSGNIDNADFSAADTRARRNTYRFLNTTGPNKGQTDPNRSAHNTYYLHTDSTDRVSNAVVKSMRLGAAGVIADPTLGGYYSINAVAPSVEFSATALARVLIASNIQAYLEGGDTAAPFGDDETRIVQIPRIEITSPGVSEIVSGTVNVELSVGWKRWDNIRYSPSYPDTFYDTVPLSYQAIYSDNNGQNWYYVASGEPVPADQINKLNPGQTVVSLAPEELLSPSAEKSFNWDMSAFPDGNYLLRAQVFRDGFENGMGYHEILLTKGSD